MEEGDITDKRGRKLKTFIWKPEGDVKGLVFLSHGYAEHLVPYYSELAEAGRGRDLLMFGLDHVGHGESEGERVMVRDMDEFTGPVIQLCQQMVDTWPGLPLFIIGHSMGGLITLLTSLSPDCPKLQGMVLMGPLIKPDPASVSRFQIFLAKVASKVLPSFQIGGLETDLVTSDPDERERINKDELHHHGGIKAMMGFTLLQAMTSLEQNFANVTTPYLMILGAEDKICNIEGSKEFHRLSGSEDKTYTEIKDGYHHLFIEQEAIRKNTFTESFDWIIKRI